MLAFENVSGDPEREFFSDDITEGVITRLSKISGLFVIARQSSFRYKRKDIGVKQIGRELGVTYVLEGSVRKADFPRRLRRGVARRSALALRWGRRARQALQRRRPLMHRAPAVGKQLRPSPLRCRLALLGMHGRDTSQTVALSPGAVKQGWR